MILILADSTDPWATVLHKELQRSSGDVCWIQPAQLLDRIQLNWPVRTDPLAVSGSVVIDDVPIALADLTGVFARLTWPPALALDDLSQPDRDYVTKETTAAWLAFLNALPCTVVNRPIPGGRPTLLAGSPLLSRIAAEQGFLLPSSRCTSIRADAILQFSAWGERVYLKALGASEPGMFLQACDGREQICRMLEQQALSMQPIPHGQRVTMYVIGDEVVGTVVKPDEAIGNGGDLAALSTAHCLGLVHALGLSFAECQFVVTPDGLRYCLDVSGAPSLWRCPQDIQQQIVSRLAGVLSVERGVPLHDCINGADSRSGARERLCQARHPEC